MVCQGKAQAGDFHLGIHQTPRHVMVIQCGTRDPWTGVCSYSRLAESLSRTSTTSLQFHSKHAHHDLPLQTAACDPCAPACNSTATSNHLAIAIPHTTLRTYRAEAAPPTTDRHEFTLTTLPEPDEQTCYPITLADLVTSKRSTKSGHKRYSQTRVNSLPHPIRHPENLLSFTPFLALSSFSLGPVQSKTISGTL